jgi:tetratricopeptide (TPR) repeat protein
MMKRIGASEEQLLDVQTNLACTYAALGRLDEALSVRHDVYSARLKLDGEEQIETIIAANNYAVTLKNLEHFEEARSVLRKVVPAARRVLGESDSLTLKVGCIYGQALYRDADATLDDLREAVTIFEEIEPTARRVMGGTHPITTGIELQLRNARAALARETPSPGSS